MDKLLAQDAKFDQMLSAAQQCARENLDLFAEYSKMVNDCVMDRAKCAALLEIFEANDEAAQEGMYFIARMAQIGFMLTTGRLLGRDI